MSLVGEVQSPMVKAMLFKNLPAALDYCQFAEPEELSIKKVFNGVEVVGYQLHFTGSGGQR